MEFRQLQHFVAIVDSGSVADAARQLKMSQPALSLSIRSLERSLGAPLFLRSSSGMSPNAFARALEPRARVILNETSNARRDIGQLLGAERGRVKVGATPTFTHAILPEAVSRFREAHPGVEIAVDEVHFDRLLPGIRSSDFDCGFVGLSGYLAPPDLACDPILAMQQAVVLAGAGHRLASRRRVTPREMWEEQWALPQRGSFICTKLTELFARAGLSLPPAAIEYGTAQMGLSILRRGGHVGVQTEAIAAEDLATGALRVIRCPELTWEFEAGALYRKTVPLTPAARKFIDMVRVVSDEMPSRSTAKRA